MTEIQLSLIKGVPTFGIFVGSVAVVQWAEVTWNRYAVTVIVLNSGVVFLSKFTWFVFFKFRFENTGIAVYFLLVCQYWPFLLSCMQ